MQNNDRYQEYFDLYNDYAKTHNLGDKYLEFGKIVEQTEHYRLLYYSPHRRESRKSYKTFLIVPSIFNSPEIFFLSRDKSFIENLRIYGEVYLIDWLEVMEPKYLLGDYVHKIIEIIAKLKIKHVNLIGHCIGGNLAIAAGTIIPELIKSLTLLTCPWDFSHFSYVKMLHQYLKLDNYIEDLPLIPKIHIQILFFLLFPDYFKAKLDKFFSLASNKEREFAFKIENWLMSGHNIPSGTYHQIIQNILGENMFMNLKWEIGNKVVDPSIISCPVYIIAAENDQIAPSSSILPLQKLFKNSKLIKLEGGHISYLINNKLTDLFKEYNRLI